MSSKQFRPPLLTKIEKLVVPIVPPDVDEPQTKRRRISSDQEDNNARLTEPRLVFKRPGISSIPRKPLLAVRNPAVAAEALDPLNGGIEGYYNVLWYVFDVFPSNTTSKQY